MLENMKLNNLSHLNQNFQVSSDGWGKKYSNLHLHYYENSICLTAYNVGHHQ
jgi:hypothetical protein